MQSLEEPLEIRVSTSNGGDGSGIIAAGLIHIDAVECVNIAPLSYLLGIGNLCNMGLKR